MLQKFMNNSITPTWEERELSYYQGTPVDIMDIHIGYSRIGYIFKLSPWDLMADFKFGKELNASFVSDFRHNELDRIGFDIEDLCSILSIGITNIQKVNTIRDYIVLFAQCRLSGDEGEYKRLIKHWSNLQHATKIGQKCFEWFGFLPKYFVKGK
jgi:hypothetical protein